MLSIAELLEAARTIRPLLPTLMEAETAQQVDQQLGDLLNQPAINDKATAQQIRTLLQSYASTQEWVAEFSETVSTQRSHLPGDPSLQPATKYECPINKDTIWYQEANEDIPLCTTHLVYLVPAQRKMTP